MKDKFLIGDLRDNIKGLSPYGSDYILHLKAMTSIKLVSYRLLKLRFSADPLMSQLSPGNAQKWSEKM